MVIEKKKKKIKGLFSNNIFKKFFCLLIVFVLVFSVLPLETSANAPQNQEVAEEEIGTTGGEPSLIDSVKSESKVEGIVGGIGAKLRKFDFLNDDIDLFTGRLTFSVPLISLPSREGLPYDLSLAYDNQNINLLKSNFVNPTSNVGLGWNMGSLSIQVDNRGTLTTKDDRYYLGNSELIHLDNYPNYEWTLKGNKDYSKIVEFPSQLDNHRVWALTKVDGTTYYFGETDNSLDFFLSCENSLNVQGGCGQWQKHISKWGLSKIVDTSGNEINFEYKKIEEQIRAENWQGIFESPDNYTKESYLSKIISPTGFYVELNYDNKEDFEYLEFYDFQEPDAYQERSIRKLYLDNVILYNSDDYRISKVKLNYDFLIHPSVSNHTIFKKRILSGLTYLGKNDNIELPPLSFDYYLSSEDNVFSGSLKSVFYPNGGQISYDYKTVNLNTRNNYTFQHNDDSQIVNSYIGNNYFIYLTQSEVSNKYNYNLYLYEYENGEFIQKLNYEFTGHTTPYGSYDYSSRFTPQIKVGDNYFVLMWNPHYNDPEYAEISVFYKDSFDTWDRHDVTLMGVNVGGNAMNMPSLSNYFTIVNDGFIFAEQYSPIKFHYVYKEGFFGSWNSVVMSDLCNKISLSNINDIKETSLSSTQGTLLIKNFKQNWNQDQTLYAYNFKDSDNFNQGILINSTSIYGGIQPAPEFADIYNLNGVSKDVILSSAVRREFSLPNLFNSGGDMLELLVESGTSDNSYLQNLLAPNDGYGPPMVGPHKWFEGIDNLGNHYVSTNVIEGESFDYSYDSENIVTANHRVYATERGGCGRTTVNSLSSLCDPVFQEQSVGENDKIFLCRMFLDGGYLFVLEPKSDYSYDLLLYLYDSNLPNQSPQLLDTLENIYESNEDYSIEDISFIMSGDSFIVSFITTAQSLYPYVTLNRLNRNIGYVHNAELSIVDSYEIDQPEAVQLFGSHELARKIISNSYSRGNSVFDNNIILTNFQDNTFQIFKIQPGFGFDGGYAKTWVVSNKTVKDGFGNDYTTSYSFNEGILDDSLSTPQFSIVTKEFPRGVGSETTFFYNGFLDSIQDNCPVLTPHWDKLNGLICRNIVKNSSSPPGQYMQETKNFYDVSMINETWDIYEINLDKTQQTLDSITSTTEYTYNFENGLPRKVITYNDNAGKELHQYTTYAYEYNSMSDMEDKHMLSQPHLQIIGDENTVFSGGFANIHDALSVSQVMYENDFGNSNKWYPSWSKVWKDSDEDGEVDNNEMKKVSEILEYDSYGNVLESVDGLGSHSYIYYGANGECNQNGGWSGNSLPTCAENELGHTQKITYDNNFNVIEVQDPNNFITEYSYDNFNRLIATRLSSDSFDSVTYDYNYGLDNCDSLQLGVEDCMNWVKTKVVMDNSLGKETIAWSFVDGLGRNMESAVFKDDNNVIVTDTNYNERGLVDNVTAPYVGSLSKTNSPTYFGGPGNLKNGADEENVKYFYYDDPLGRIWKTFPINSYEQGDELIDCLVAGNICTEFEYGSEICPSQTGLTGECKLQKVTDANGVYIKSYSDMLGNTVYIEAPENVYSIMNYDILGQLTESTNALGQKSNSTYNTLGQVTKSCDVDNGCSLMKYDKLGNVMNLKNDLGVEIFNDYDSLNRLIKVYVCEDISGEDFPYCDLTNGVVWFVNYYDLNSEGGSCICENYNYDSKTCSTLHSTSKGMLCEIKNINQNTGIKYLYDIRGRVLQIDESFLDKSFITQYNYDDAGDRIYIETDDFSIANYDYNLLGQVNKITISDASNLASLRPKFNLIQFFKDLFLPNSKISGNSIKEAFRSFITGFATLNLDEEINYEYYGEVGENNVGKLKKVGFSDTLIPDFDYYYNAQGWVGEISSSYLEELYDYDDVGNLNNILDIDAGRVYFNYDDLYRLTKINNAQGGGPQGYYSINGTKLFDSVDYDYDAIGNRQSRTVNNNNHPEIVHSISDYVYSGNSNRLLEDDDCSYEYDIIGNLITKNCAGEITNYNYNALGKLMKVTMPDESFEIYRYSPAGNRIYKYNSKSKTKSYYSYGGGSKPILDKIEEPFKKTQIIESVLFGLGDVYGASCINDLTEDFEGDIEGILEEGAFCYSIPIEEIEKSNKCLRDLKEKLDSQISDFKNLVSKKCLKEEEKSVEEPNLLLEKDELKAPIKEKISEGNFEKNYLLFKQDSLKSAQKEVLKLEGIYGISCVRNFSWDFQKDIEIILSREFCSSILIKDEEEYNDCLYDLKEELNSQTNDFKKVVDEKCLKKEEGGFKEHQLLLLEKDKLKAPISRAPISARVILEGSERVLINFWEKVSKFFKGE